MENLSRKSWNAIPSLISQVLVRLLEHRSIVLLLVYCIGTVGDGHRCSGTLGNNTYILYKEHGL